MSEKDIEYYRNLAKSIKGKVAESKRTCTNCKATNKVLTSKGICYDCRKAEEFDRRRKNQAKSVRSKEGYIYSYDSEGRLVLKHRLIMQEVLGRTLEPHEAVTFKDGDRSNIDPENLMLILKAGFKLQELECPHCGQHYY